MPLPFGRTRWALALPLLLAAGHGCGADESNGPSEAPPAGPPGTPTEGVEDGPTWDRTLVFVSARADSAVVIPWFFRSIERDDVTLRERAVWLARAGTWEVLGADTTSTPPGRAPWRIVPGPTIRLLVGADDAIEALVFRSPPRELELRAGELLGEWAGADGGVARLLRGTAVLPSEEVPGLVLDLARGWQGDAQRPGDWIFLHAGDGTQLFLEEEPPVDEPRSPSRFRGWSRVAFQEQIWPDVEVTWEEVGAFERARRDVPVRWRLASPGGEVEGDIRSVSRHLAAGEGDEPLLPVGAFFEVEGEVRIRGESHAIRGLVRHVQW